MKDGACGPTRAPAGNSNLTVWIASGISANGGSIDCGLNDSASEDGQLRSISSTGFGGMSRMGGASHNSPPSQI